MTHLMLSLRRSPRTLLERDGHPGPGPGQLALVMARAGVGKTAFLGGIAVDALLSGQKVLHISLERTVERIRDWYDDILMELLRREKKLEHWAALQLEVERNRHIHTYVDQSFSIDRVRQSLTLLRETMDFVPAVIVLDRMEYTDLDAPTVAELKSLAAEVHAELWMACRTHRDGPQGEPGHLPPPAASFEEHVDLAFRLDPHDAKIRLHILKDKRKMIDEDLNILLDPQTMLLMTGVVTRR